MDYHLNPDNIYLPPFPVTHRDEEYAQGGFAALCEMQERHFWYRGRHRFLLDALDRYLPKPAVGLAAIDLGGGAGGWVQYLAKKRAAVFTQLALADSSLIALTHARKVLPPNAQRYQIDLMNLHMHEEWDAAFLLDVIEHIPDDRRALQQAQESLKPGGLLFVTAPAFQQFWSYNDELAHHLRRYTCADFAHLGEQVGLQFCDARYFMFLLSRLYWLARQGKGIEGITEEEKMELMNKTHQVPSALLNLPLTAIFAAETPLGHWLRFPWGTSVLGVFRK